MVISGLHNEFMMPFNKSNVGKNVDADIALK